MTSNFGDEPDLARGRNIDWQLLRFLIQSQRRANAKGIKRICNFASYISKAGDGSRTVRYFFVDQSLPNCDLKVALQTKNFNWVK